MQNTSVFSKSTSSVNEYLQSIGKIPMLTAEKEVFYSKQVDFYRNYLKARGKLLGDKDSYTLTDKEASETLNMSISEMHSKVAESMKGVKSQADFKRQLERSLRARNMLIQSNLRLVVSIAKKYLNRGLDFLDLIQEGSLGLERATVKFKHKKGYKFSTYSTWWIRQAITRAIDNQGRTIRLPIHLSAKIKRLKKLNQKFYQTTSKRPSIEDTVALWNEDEKARHEKRVEGYKNGERRSKPGKPDYITADELRALMSKAESTVSYDVPVGDSEDTQLKDYLASTLAEPGEFIREIEQNNALADLMENLTDAEKEVVSLRFGLTAPEPLTLAATGDIIGVSRERVRQIQANAMSKMFESRDDIASPEDLFD